MHILLFGLAILLFIGLVLIHEWGHFIVAKRNGIKSEEFGLFFPPRIVGKKLASGLVISLNWLPLGGFVRLKGERDSDTEQGSFGAASLWAKTKVLLAGVGMNLAAALVLLTILGWVGMPVLIDKTLDSRGQFTVKSDTRVISQQVEAGDIVPGSPAARAGLSGNDIILSIKNGTDVRYIHTTDQLRAATHHFAGQSVELELKHRGAVETKQIKLLSADEVAASLQTDKPQGNLGIVPYPLVIQRSTWSAPIVAFGVAGQMSELTLKAVGHAFAGLGSAIAGLASGNHTARENGQTQASSQVGGPIAISQVLWNSGNLGINFVLVLIAIISLTLALVNLFPIPAMDGGRLYMTLIYRGILKKPVSRETEEKIVGLGWVIILVLIVLITISDVTRFH